MARDRRTTPGDAARERALRLFRAGSPEFVEVIRTVTEAKGLAVFAGTWYTDPRIEARRLLHGYLERPFNAVRHEPLVKRLFKFAEAAGDDATVAHFLAGFDRTVRRRMKIRQAWNYRSRELEERQVISTPPDTEMPRSEQFLVGPWFQKNREGRFVFSVATRNYLRRRAWRYFRRLGRTHPECYLPAVSVALKLYTDADVPDGLGLLDNWGLVHVLFHHSPTLEARPAGWRRRGELVAGQAPARPDDPQALAQEPRAGLRPGDRCEVPPGSPVGDPDAPAALPRPALVCDHRGAAGVARIAGAGAERPRGAAAGEGSRTRPDSGRTLAQADGVVPDGSARPALRPGRAVGEAGVCLVRRRGEAGDGAAGPAGATRAGAARPEAADHS